MSENNDQQLDETTESTETAEQETTPETVQPQAPEPEEESATTHEDLDASEPTEGEIVFHKLVEKLPGPAQSALLSAIHGHISIAGRLDEHRSFGIASAIVDATIADQEIRDKVYSHMSGITTARWIGVYSPMAGIYGQKERSELGKVQAIAQALDELFAE